MKTKKQSRLPKPKETVSQAAHLLGKRSWNVRLERFGLKALQAKMRKVGKEATGRPLMKRAACLLSCVSTINLWSFLQCILASGKRNNSVCVGWM